MSDETPSPPTTGEVGSVGGDQATTRRRAALGTAVFLVVAPGTVAGLVPYFLTRWQVAEPAPPVLVQGLGWVLLVAGVAVLLQSFGRFVVDGLGTPAPVAPTRRLVVSGWYRFVRNPMYVAIIAIVLGQAAVLGRLVLLVYAVVTWAIPAAFVRWYEEPTLLRTYGTEYERYRAAVPAWLPRARPWSPREP